MPWRALAVAVLALGALGATLAAVQAPLFDLDRFAIPKELALSLTALIGLAVLWRWRPEPDTGVVTLGLLAFAGWSVASAIVASNHWLALRAAALTVSGVVVFLLARAASRDSSSTRTWIVASLAAAALAAGATGLAEAYGWSSPLLAATRSPGGLLGNRNFLAHLLVLAVPLVAWLVLRARGRLAWVVGGVAIAALAAGIVLSRSRAAWLGLSVEACAGLIAIVTSRLRRSDWPGGQPAGRLSGSARGALRALCAGAAAGLVVAIAVPNELAWTSETPYRDSLRDVLNYRTGSGKGRLVQYGNSARLVARDPLFGTGPGNWVVHYPLVTTPGDPSFNAVDPMPTNPWPSSDWVALAAERGIVGFMLFGATLLAMLGVAVRRLPHPDPDVRLRAGTSAALACAAAVMGLFDAVLLLAPPTFLAMAGLGALLPETRPLPLAARPRWRAAALAIGVLVVGGATARGGMQLAAMRAAGTGSPRARLERAVRLDPTSYRLRMLLAIRAPCPEAAQHAASAAKAFPHHPAPKAAARRCAGGRDRAAP